ncbi:hypothetical protein ACFLVV_01155 [Chloroflexota bacterium]
MQTNEELKHELADVLTKIDKTEKKLKRLRRPPTDVSRGRARVSFITNRELMAEAAEIMKERDSLKRRELEIRDKLQSHSE